MNSRQTQKKTVRYCLTGHSVVTMDVPKYRYYDILQYFVLGYVIDTLVPNIDI